MYKIIKNIKNIVIILSVVFYSGQSYALNDHNNRNSNAYPKIIKKVFNIPMRDGIMLAADLYIQENAEQKFPVLLIRTPYKKEMQEFGGRFFASKGYAVVIQDVRGRFASKGKWEPFINEAEDGYDTIEWLAEQDWSTGKIGMLGGSYLASAQVLAAKLRPPHLVTIIPNALPADPFFNSPYEYGVFFMTPSIWWVNVIETNATDDISERKLQESHKVKTSGHLNSLPVIDLDKKIVGKEVAYWRDWILHNSNDQYWKKANYTDALKDLNIPVFLQSGWFDTQSIGTELAYFVLGKSKNKNIKMLMGPWNHVNQVPNTPSTRNMGDESKIDINAQYLKWFDYWLKGIENKILDEPLVQLYILNSKKWVKSAKYPLPQTKYRKLYLSSSTGANTLLGDGKLSWDLPEKIKESDSYTYNPADPAPAPAYRFDKGRKGFDSITSNRRDILVFQSEPLDKPVTIAGPISSKIFASTSGYDTDWFVTLYAVTEKDQHVQMVRGAIRARFRNSVSKPLMLVKNKIYEYNIDLWQMGITLEKGWRLRVEIASAYFPEFSRNLNTGGNNEMGMEFEKADQKIFHSKKYPSHIILPVIQLEN